MVFQRKSRRRSDGLHQASSRPRLLRRSTRCPNGERWIHDDGYRILLHIAKILGRLSAGRPSEARRCGEAEASVPAPRLPGCIRFRAIWQTADVLHTRRDTAPKTLRSKGFVNHDSAIRQSSLRLSPYLTIYSTGSNNSQLVNSGSSIGPFAPIPGDLDRFLHQDR
jgi:hypothetical protein